MQGIQYDCTTTVSCYFPVDWMKGKHTLSHWMTSGKIKQKWTFLLYSRKKFKAPRSSWKKALILILGVFLYKNGCDFTQIHHKIVFIVLVKCSIWIIEVKPSKILGILHRLQCILIIFQWTGWRGSTRFPTEWHQEKSSKNELFYSILARNLKLHGHLEMVLLLAKIKKNHFYETFFFMLWKGLNIPISYICKCIK
jgi:hypothetical protein